MIIKMKYHRSKLIIFSLAILIPFGAQAVDIIDSYATDDPLTATLMTNIKSAVNSKQNIVTGTCPAGQSIRVINADGTVTCLVDIVGTGDITGVTAGTGLAGGGASGAVTLSIATGGVGAAQIASGALINQDVNAAAAIAISKISGDVGFEFNAALSTANIPTNDATVKNMGSITLTNPGAGHVLVYVSGHIVFFGDNKTINVGVGDSATVIDTFVTAGNLDGALTQRYEVPFSTIGVFSVTAGSRTFFALAQGNTTFGTGSVNVVSKTLVGIFIPKRY